MERPTPAPDHPWVPAPHDAVSGPWGLFAPRVEPAPRAPSGARDLAAEGVRCLRRRLVRARLMAVALRGGASRGRSTRADLAETDHVFASIDELAEIVHGLPGPAQVEGWPTVALLALGADDARPTRLLGAAESLTGVAADVFVARRVIEVAAASVLRWGKGPTPGAATALATDRLRLALEVLSPGTVTRLERTIRERVASAPFQRALREILGTPPPRIRRSSAA